MKDEVKATGEKAADEAKTPAFKNRRRRRSLRIVMPRVTRRRVSIVAILVFILAVAAWVHFTGAQGQSINRSAYQVVYLSNGQAYFGKLQNTNGEYLCDEQPYSAQSVQPDPKAGEAAPTTTLLRVRDQVYGPDDSIAIRAETVAFWQNLRDDSKITALLKSKQ